MPNAVGKGRGFIRLIFIPNHKKPLTASEIADITNIPRHIVSIRAARAASKKATKKYQGQDCAVLTKKDLVLPMQRKSNGKRYIVKLTDGQVQVVMGIKGRTAEQKEVLNEIKRIIRPRPNAVGIWNAMVLGKKKDG